MSDISICEYCKYKNIDMIQNPCIGCSAQMGAFEFDMSEHDKQIREEAIDEFKDKLCSTLEEYQTGFNMVSMANVWHFSEEIAEKLKEQK